ncbi:hypothetical protein LTR36_006082 [Oleoguttula mirabilis]|uniref:Uncharacterized protein n=1 Tax=Oleoguttula mirabilis TaxID=1507867 RepID=A0AAV9JCS4_9PEZI|nr:hypothetical protein LTR36_006082 [Oleoguttula mirabilis]
MVPQALTHDELDGILDDGNRRAAGATDAADETAVEEHLLQLLMQLATSSWSNADALCDQVTVIAARMREAREESGALAGLLAPYEGQMLQREQLRQDFAAAVFDLSMDRLRSVDTGFRAERGQELAREHTLARIVAGAQKAWEYGAGELMGLRIRTAAVCAADHVPRETASETPTKSQERVHEPRPERESVVGLACENNNRNHQPADLQVHFAAPEGQEPSLERRIADAIIGTGLTEVDHADFDSLLNEADGQVDDRTRAWAAICAQATRMRPPAGELGSSPSDNSERAPGADLQHSMNDAIDSHINQLEPATVEAEAGLEGLVRVAGIGNEDRHAERPRTSADAPVGLTQDPSHDGGVSLDSTLREAGEDVTTETRTIATALSYGSEGDRQQLRTLWERIAGLTSSPSGASATTAYDQFSEDANSLTTDGADSFATDAVSQPRDGHGNPFAHHHDPVVLSQLITELGEVPDDVFTEFVSGINSYVGPDGYRCERSPLHLLIIARQSVALRPVNPPRTPFWNYGVFLEPRLAAVIHDPSVDHEAQQALLRDWARDMGTLATIISLEMLRRTIAHDRAVPNIIESSETGTQLNWVRDVAIREAWRRSANDDSSHLVALSPIMSDDFNDRYISEYDHSVARRIQAARRMQALQETQGGFLDREVAARGVAVYESLKFPDAALHNDAAVELDASDTHGTYEERHARREVAALDWPTGWQRVPGLPREMTAAYARDFAELFSRAENDYIDSARDGPRQPVIVPQLRERPRHPQTEHRRCRYRSPQHALLAEEEAGDLAELAELEGRSWCELSEAGVQALLEQGIRLPRSGRRRVYLWSVGGQA